MASTIDTTKPTSGVAYTADVRENFIRAKTEIEALQSHAASTTNPHSVTATQVGADPAGTASAAIATHESESDPHPQYFSATTDGEIAALTLVTVDAEDHILIEDASDANSKKRIAASDLLSGAGDVTGPAGATDSNFAAFDGTTGKLIKDSVYSPTSFTPAAHVGTGGTEHADATTTVAGFMSASDKTKLDGIEAGAEVNNISDVNATDLTDGGLTTLHGHEQDGILYPAALTIGTPTGHNTLQEIIDHSWSAGVTHGGDITDNLDGTVSFATATAVLRATTDAHAPLYNIAVPAQLNLALTDQAVNWVYLSYNAGTPQWEASTAITAFNCIDKCIGYTIYRDGNVLNIIDAREQNVDGNRKTRKFLLNVNRFPHAVGSTVLGANGLALTVTAGTFYFMLQDLPHDAFDTSIAGTANANIFKLWYRDGIGGWTGTVEQKVIGTATYDGNTGTPVTLGNNKFGVSWVYLVHDSPSSLHVVMGQVEYPDAATARVATPPSSLPGLVAEHGSLIGFVVYEKSATAFANVLSAFGLVFGSSAATSHNELAGLQGGVLGEYYHLTAAQATDLTDAGDSTLHYHATDRDRANHTGTQTATTVTITDTGGYFTATDVEGALQEIGAGGIGGGGGDITVDGGFANSTYLTTQNIDGGAANG